MGETARLGVSANRQCYLAQFAELLSLAFDSASAQDHYRLCVQELPEKPPSSDFPLKRARPALATDQPPPRQLGYWRFSAPNPNPTPNPNPHPNPNPNPNPSPSPNPNQVNEYLNVLQSVQLPFAMLPVLHFTASRRRLGRFVSGRKWMALSVCLALLVIAINVTLATRTRTRTQSRTRTQTRTLTLTRLTHWRHVRRSARRPLAE